MTSLSQLLAEEVEAFDATFPFIEGYFISAVEMTSESAGKAYSATPDEVKAFLTASHHRVLSAVIHELEGQAKKLKEAQTSDDNDSDRMFDLGARSVIDIMRNLIKSAMEI